MDEGDEESLSLSSSRNNKIQQRSVDNLVNRMKFARETSGLTMPTWQAPAQVKGKYLIKIFDQIIEVLIRSSDHLTIGAQNSDGETQARITPMVYFTGLLISNFHPKADEIEETFGRLDSLFSSIENETLLLLKTLKKFSAKVEAFTKIVHDEFNRPVYKSFVDLEQRHSSESEGDMFERLIFKKYSLHNFPGVWLEMINLETEVLYLQCPEIAGQDGHTVRILAENLPLESGLKVGSLLLAEVEEAVRKAMTALAEVDLKPEAVKEWKESAIEFVRYIKYVRTTHNFGEWNCATELSDTLSEINWKLNVVIDNKFRVLKNVCVWILKGIECVRRKTGNWATDRDVLTSPQVLKYISNPRPKISKLLPCFQARPQANPMDFPRMFRDIGKAIGDGFLLEVVISDTIKEALFAEYLATKQDSSNESLTEVEAVESVVEELVSSVGLEKDDNDSDEEVDAVANALDSDVAVELDLEADSVEVDPNSPTQNQSPVSERISRRDSPVEQEQGDLLNTSEPCPDSSDFATNSPVTEKTAADTEPSVEVDNVSSSSNQFFSMESELQGPSNPVEQNHDNEDDNNLGKSVSQNETASTATGLPGTQNQPSRRIPFYWARRLIERVSKNK